MELGFIRDRQRVGIEAAKAKGVYKGRLVTLDRSRIKAMRAEGIGATEIAKAIGCSRGAVYKALRVGIQPGLRFAGVTSDWDPHHGYC